MDLSGEYFMYNDMIIITGSMSGELTTFKLVMLKMLGYSY